MKPLHSRSHASLRNNSGQGLTEYLILLILIAVTCIVTVHSMGDVIKEKLAGAKASINSVSFAGTAIENGKKSGGGSKKSGGNIFGDGI